MQAHLTPYREVNMADGRQRGRKLLKMVVAFFHHSSRLVSIDVNTWSTVPSYHHWLITAQTSVDAFLKIRTGSNLCSTMLAKSLINESYRIAV